MINYIDNTDRQGSNVSKKVNECCNKMEALVVEWKMEAILTDLAVRLPLRCLVADHIMNIYAVIVGLKRLANRVDNIAAVDEMTVRAARKVVGTLLDFEQDVGAEDRRSPDPVDYFCQYVTFSAFVFIIISPLVFLRTGYKAYQVVPLQVLILP